MLFFFLPVMSKEKKKKNHTDSYGNITEGLLSDCFAVLELHWRKCVYLLQILYLQIKISLSEDKKALQVTSLKWHLLQNGFMI